MPIKPKFFRAVVLSFCSAIATLAQADVAQAKKSFDTLYVFNGSSDGGNPKSGLIVDKKGNLYGTTWNGPDAWAGSVFKISRDGSQVILHRFGGGKDGSYLYAGLIADAEGNLYGTTYAGGGRGCEQGTGCGTLFKLAPDGTETILHAFAPRDDGRHPYAGLVMDSAGNLYGTTPDSGVKGCQTACGTVFKVTPDGTETVLHVFGQTDGSYSLAPLIVDKAGNLYGTTLGTVFKLAPDGTETILYVFKGGNDGADSVAPLITDANGNLYGTTMFGGGGACLSGGGCGAVFKLAPDGTETVLYSFKGGTDGFLPQAGLVMDATGNLFGTTSKGGGTGCDSGHGCGTVFKLAPDGTETVLHAFVNPQKGFAPLGGLVADKNGRLFGTTSGGGADGHGQGIVFKITSY